LIISSEGLTIPSQGPNPWKVAIILNELNIPYETELMDFSVLHQGNAAISPSSRSTKTQRRKQSMS
jgi:hypothetical protein